MIWWIPAGYAAFLALLVYRYGSRRPRLADYPPRRTGSLVSVIVPARNEAMNIERCAGLGGGFDRVEWYQVPGSSYSCPAYEGQCDGWWRAPHTIYMAQTRLYDRQVAEHEMLHDLLQRGDHPPVFRACGV